MNKQNKQNIFRYKFATEFIDVLYNFSKIHQYDERKDFKEAWNEFKETNLDIINQEIFRLNENGYTGDVLDKMFKSARYYFRNKCIKKIIPKERQQYVSVTKELLDSIDLHINNNIFKEDYKPSIYFDKYCIENTTVLKNEILFLSRNGYDTPQDIKTKLKKTYKNRYYLLSKLVSVCID
jgi:hypothetical protein